MTLFLSLVLAVYAAVQLFVLWELRRAFPRRGLWRLVPLGILLVMNAGFLLARGFAHRGWTGPARALSLVAHWWAVASLWLLLMGAAAEAWNLAMRRIARTRGGARRLLIPPRALMIAATAIVAGLSAWGFYEAGAVRLETLTVHTPRLRAGSAPIRIVQVSDLHLSSLMSRGRLERILALVREARPDLLVFTGDFTDEFGPYIDELVARLAELDAPLGKLAVTGNHEFYHDLLRSVALMEAAGFRVLRSESVRVGDGLVVAGVDDWAGRWLGSAAFLDEGRALPPRNPTDVVILLKHQPVVEPGSPGRFDLQLSGHTHGGQILPGILCVLPFYRHVAGRYDLPGGAVLYVSRGAGTFGPPMRVLSPPEVTLILIER